MQTKLDSIIANVYDLDKVLRVLEINLNLKPFFKNTILLGTKKTTRMALVSLINGDFEFIECAETAYPEQMSRISEVHIECPTVTKETCIALEDRLILHAVPGKKPTITKIITLSNDPAADSDVLLNFCDNCSEHPLPDGGKEFNIERIHIHFLQKPSSTISTPTPKGLSTFHGWRRFSLSVNKLQLAVALLERAGAVTVIPIFQVMPGLQEAMMRLPSGLIVQPVEQKLLRMMPGFLWQKIKEVWPH